MGRQGQQGPRRPSAKEATKKLRDALVALRERRCSVALTKHSSMSLTFLGCGESEMWGVIEELVEELLSLDNPGVAYAGSYPPQKSYEAGFKDDELWAYRWTSSRMGVETYIKFAMKKKGWFCFFDCHEHQEK